VTTLTDKRCRSKIEEWCRQVEKIYETKLKNRKPSDQFWTDLTQVEIDLWKSMNKRPITVIEISMACNSSIKKFISLCDKHGQQARDTHSEGGA
jgi:hypothetical protein